MTSNGNVDDPFFRRRSIHPLLFRRLLRRDDRGDVEGDAELLAIGDLLEIPFVLPFPLI